MKNQRSFLVFLGIEALLLLALVLLGAADGLWASGILGFPFVQIGCGLRVLSLLGGAGNVLALVVYIVISASPLVYLVWLWKKRELFAEDCLLVVLSILTFFTLYYMVNPGLIPGIADFLWSDGGAFYQSLYSGTIYGLLFCYAILRIVRLLKGAEKAALQKYLAVLLRILAVVFVYLAFGACVQNLLGAIENLRAGNTMLVEGWHPILGLTYNGLGISYGFLVLRCLANMVPYLLDVAVTLAALDLLTAMKEDRYSEKSIQASEKLSHLCVVSLSVTVVVTALLNLLQLMFLGELHTVHINVYVPVLSVAFVLAVLLLNRLLGENKSLKEDNDLFI
ncbi:MAG: hypothetical protein IKB65_08815 [Ruminiclostridium sp.]|nr:hypothetical protein [Ruminiclostridium sp.]